MPCRKCPNTKHEVQNRLLILRLRLQVQNNQSSNLKLSATGLWMPILIHWFTTLCCSLDKVSIRALLSSTLDGGSVWILLHWEHAHSSLAAHSPRGGTWLAHEYQLASVGVTAQPRHSVCYKHVLPSVVRPPVSPAVSVAKPQQALRS